MRHMLTFLLIYLQVISRRVESYRELATTGKISLHTFSNGLIREAQRRAEI